LAGDLGLLLADLLGLSLQSLRVATRPHESANEN